MIPHHSTFGHAAHHDLLRLLQQQQVSALRGTPSLETRNGKSYWYDSYRVGAQVKKSYIGEDTADLAAQILAHRDLAAQVKEAAAARLRLVRLLRAEGYTMTDAANGSLLKALAEAGVFRLGGTIVGTQAFRLYEGALGIRYAFEQLSQTDDLDIAQFERLSLAVNDKVETPLSQRFKDLAFEPLPTMQSSAVWRWKQSSTGALVEFLTPSFRPEEDIRPLPALGVSAQSLHYLNYLIAEPIKAAVLYRSGVLVQIPQPERYAIHKLIVADRRRGGPDQIKSHKDRAQAAFLIEVLAQDRPEELLDAYTVALASGPRWGERIASSLRRMPKTAAVLAAL